MSYDPETIAEAAVLARACRSAAAYAESGLALPTAITLAAHQQAWVLDPTQPAEELDRWAVRVGRALAIHAEALGLHVGDLLAGGPAREPIAASDFAALARALAARLERLAEPQGEPA